MQYTKVFELIGMPWVSQQPQPTAGGASAAPASAERQVAIGAVLFVQKDEHSIELRYEFYDVFKPAVFTDPMIAPLPLISDVNIVDVAYVSKWCVLINCEQKPK